MLRAWQVAAVLGLLAAAGGSAAAASGETTFAVPAQDPTSMDFVVPLPELEPGSLVSQIREARTELEARRLHYQEVVEDSRMTVGKLILALIAPGGLLMAVGSELVHSQAENKVVSLDREIQELSSDLAIFEGIERDRRVILARYP